VLLGIAIALTGPARVRAQGGGVGAVVISARHELLGGLLTRGAVTFSPARDGPLAFQLEASLSHGHADRIDVVCAGLIQPGTCPAEQVRDETRFASASGGAALRVLRGHNAGVDLTADLTLASVQADTRGLSTGATLTASKLLWGALIGARVTWTPVTRVPVALEIAGGVGGLMPLVHDDVVDGYAPFEAGFDVRQARLGVVWQP